MARTLDEWLEYQLQTHPQAIAMGLERTREVAARMQLGKPAAHVVTVGGTNGKGSTVAFIEAIARSAGLSVGAFTSPHLLRYNERVRINGRECADADLISAFEAIESVRGDIPLTYFEFGTLAALWIFARAGLDLAILEVGLGGRLDAVNIIDADVAVITTVHLDHQEYLGPDRETIGAEKAGIFRAGKPCVLAESDPPSSVLGHAYAIGAFAIRAQADYLYEDRSGGWTWREPGFELLLQHPLMDAGVQKQNAAAAIATLRALPLDIPDRAFQNGIASAWIPGRLQAIAERPQVVVDVAHNPQAAAQLVAWLRAKPAATRAVFSALRDKDIEAIVGQFEGLISHWHLAGIEDAGARGLAAAELVVRLKAALPALAFSIHDSIADALAAARLACGRDERVLVFGSFHTVAAALAAVGRQPERL